MAASNNSSVETWLKANNLSKLKQVFEDNDLIIEELCEFDNDQLTAFIAEQKEIYADQKYFDVLTQHRLKKAIKNTTQKINNTNNSRDTNPNSKHNNKAQIIVTPQEHEAMRKLYHRFDKICELKESIQQKAFKELEQCSIQLCQTDIASQLDQIISTVQSYKQQLLGNIDQLLDVKTAAINKQLQSIQLYQREVHSKRAEFESMVYGQGSTDSPFQNIDLAKRNKLIVKETQKVLCSENAQMALVTQPNIKFVVPNDKMKQFFSDEFVLNPCDQPVIASFEIVKIGFCYLQISFHWQSKNVNEYEISIALTKRAKKTKDDNIAIKRRKNAKKAKKSKSKTSSFASGNNSANSNFGSFLFGSNDTNNASNPFNSAMNDWSNSFNQSNNSFSFAPSNVSNANNAFFSFGSAQKDSVQYKFGIDNIAKKPKKKSKKSSSKSAKNVTNDDDIKREVEKEGSLIKTSNKSSEKVAEISEFKYKSANEDTFKWKSERENASKYNGKYKTIYNLKPECEYLIKMRGRNDCGWGHYSKCLSFTTKSQPKSKQMELELVECRGHYRRSRNNNGMYYNPIHLLRPQKQYNNFTDMDDLECEEEEYMYASDRGYTFGQNENDWIIFKPTKTKHRRYYITEIALFGTGEPRMPKTFKVEFGDKKSLKLQKPVPDPEMRNVKMKKRPMKCAKAMSSYYNKPIKVKKSKKRKKKSAKQKRKKYVSSDAAETESDSDSDSDSDSSESESEEFEKKKKESSREWISTKPKLLETQLRYGRQSFCVKPKIISDRKCDYIKISFVANHNPAPQQKGCKFMLSRLEMWGIVIKD